MKNLNLTFNDVKFNFYDAHTDIKDFLLDTLENQKDLLLRYKYMLNHIEDI